MIDLVYKTLTTILNKENSGYVSPTEFNILANNVQYEIFSSYFEDENRDKNRQNRGLTNKGYGNSDFNQRQKINKFSSIAVLTSEDGEFDLPTDLFYIEDDGITDTDTNRVIEEAERSKIAYLNQSLSGASITYPLYERYTSSIFVYPDTVTEISLRYIRKPSAPQWTYTVYQDKELFNQSSGSYKDFDLHPSEFTNIVNRMLLFFGINLQEQLITQTAESLKDKEYIKDNQ